MGTISDQFARVFRDYVTDGVEASGLNEVEKSEARSIGPLIEAAIATMGLGAAVDVTYATRAALEADLAHDAGSIGLVYADAADANNDIYVKSGASGAGSWALGNALHEIIRVLAQPYVTAAQAAADKVKLDATDERLAVIVDGSADELELVEIGPDGRPKFAKLPLSLDRLVTLFGDEIDDGSGDLFQMIDPSADERFLMRITAAGELIAKISGVDPAGLATAITNAATAVSTANTALAQAQAGSATQLLRGAALRAQAGCRFSNAVMASPPTSSIVTGSAPASGLTRSYAPTSGALKFIGGETVAFSGGAYLGVSAVTYSGANGNLGSGKSALHWAVETCSEAPKVTFVVDSDMSSGWFRLWVDDQLAVDFTRIDAAANGAHAITFDFGTSAIRTLRFDCFGNSKFGSAWVGPNYSLWHPGEQIRAVFVMDSQGEGIAGRGGAWPAVTPGLALPTVAGAWLGWDNVRQAAIGATGYLQDSGGASGKWKWNDHKIDWTGWNPTALVFWGSINDTALDQAAAANNALTAWQDARAALPKVPIIVAGILGDPTYSAVIGTMETALANKFTSWADPNSLFVPCANDPTGPWLKGNGYVASPTGNGNGDIYRGDTVHLNPLGDLVIGRRFADAVRPWLLSR